MSYEIQLIDLAKTYHDDTPALAGVNLTCPRSRTTTLLGPSGSGKSTILKIVAGLLRPTGGAVLFEGKDVTWLPPEKRNIGMVFQHYALFPNMTVRENVEFGLLVRGVRAPEREKRATKALEIVQIAALGHRRIHQLSGGQQQRVALARAVVFQPDILLLDEPLSALDAKIRHELRSELARLLREFRITAVYVTHDQQEAMSLGDQVVVMDKGRIMQAGAPLEVYSRPANAFVANFIGTANVYDVVVGAPQGGQVLVKAAFGQFTIAQERFASQWPEIGSGPARLVCRPQDVTPSEEGSATTRLTVDERLFLGDRLRVSGILPGGARMQVEVPNSARIADGESLPLRIDPERLHFIAAETRVA
jgi:putative spermidine/putrescine transport system ATP-binding protein